MAEPFAVPADGTEVFRNFVIPIPVENTRYVRAVEIRPGTKRVVHHANILIDRTRSCRRLDEGDPGPGFAGMEAFGEAEMPEGHIITWVPGTKPSGGLEDLAWQLQKGTDLILNLHILPSGKPEMVNARVGFFFADKPPADKPLELVLLEFDRMIDIPPGEKEFVITDQFELPVNVQVYGVYPHAHYLGKKFDGYAIFPDGTRLSLIQIKDWDFNWQGVYQYAEPFSLPQGTTIAVRITYDNSSDNVRNPSNPPKRVKSGNSTFDEMGHLWIQVRTRNTEDLNTLRLRIYEHKIQKYPNNPKFCYNRGLAYHLLGNYRLALVDYAKAIQLKPDFAKAYNNRGLTYHKLGKYQLAKDNYDQAIKLESDYALAYYNRGRVYVELRDYTLARNDYDRAIQLKPDYALAYYNRGNIYRDLRKYDQALHDYGKAIELKPDFAKAYNNRGLTYHKLGKYQLAKDNYDQAIKLESDFGDYELALRDYNRAIKLNPDLALAYNNRGLLLARDGKWQQAADHFQTALRLQPDLAQARENLQWARAKLKQDPARTKETPNK